jgi:hypothetical protein
MMPVTFYSTTREGDLLLDDEGGGDGVGGWQRTKMIQSKSVKEIR